jgi:hypothetical protein
MQAANEAPVLCNKNWMPISGVAEAKKTIKSGRDMVQFSPFSAGAISTMLGIWAPLMESSLPAAEARTGQ